MGMKLLEVDENMGCIGGAFADRGRASEPKGWGAEAAQERRGSGARRRNGCDHAAMRGRHDGVGLWCWVVPLHPVENYALGMLQLLIFLVRLAGQLAPRHVVALKQRLVGALELSEQKLEQEILMRRGWSQPEECSFTCSNDAN